MNTSKLHEAITELKHQRALLDTAILNLESIVKSLATESLPVAQHLRSTRGADGPLSYFEEGIQILANEGKPLHINEITKRLSASRGKAIARPAVESAFLRHIKSHGNASLVVRLAPGTFGRAAWKKSETVLFSHAG